MYSKFLNKLVKLVYKDSKNQNEAQVRYVKGKVISSNKKALTLRLLNNENLFAVSLSQIVYVKELRSTKMEEEIKLEVPEWVTILKEAVRKELGGQDNGKGKVMDND